MALIPFFVKEKIWDWFGQEAVPWFTAAFKGLLDGFLRMVGPLAWAWLKIMTFVGIWLELVSLSIASLREGLIEMSSMELFKPDGALLYYGSFMNRFLPLTETFALAILISHLYFLVIVVRWVKSFIPTLSN